MAEVITDTFSDHDMQCPAEYENGFKRGLVTQWGRAELSMAERKTGNWAGSQFTFSLADIDRTLREQLAGTTDRYWSRASVVKMTNRAARAALEEPFTVFVGPITSIQPAGDLGLTITLGDIISKLLLPDTDNALFPWRLVRDCGLLNPDSTEFTFTPSGSLDLATPEATIYGIHRRIADVDPASPEGFEVTPTYLGIETIGATDYHVWMVCGHAVYDIPDVNTVTNDDDRIHQSVFGDVQWIIPHTAAFLSMFGAHYRDIRSHTFGVDRRYTMILAEVGNTEADDVVAGDKTLACFVEGVEDIGDGGGNLITDRVLQYQHFMINYVANAGASGYQSGDWLTNPSWDIFGQDAPVIDEDSFTECVAIALERLPLPAGSPPPVQGGYIGAAVIGANAGDRAPVPKWVSDWNRSCGCAHRINNFGQFGITMLHPTQAIKDAAPLYTDAYEILKDSFQPGWAFDQHVNRQPFLADYDHLSGNWKTSDFAQDDQSIANWEEIKFGETRYYPFAPGITMAYHLARISVLETKDPPRPIRLGGTIGPDNDGDSMGYRIPGDYIRYRHFSSISEDAEEIRLAYVIKRTIDVQTREVFLDCLDCDHLIDFDVPQEDAGSVSPSNQTCADALELAPSVGVALNYVQETDTHGTDSSMGGSPTVWSGGEAYHAAWFEFTPTVDGLLQINTLGSEYDTKLGVFSGSCGSLTEDGYNDNYEDMMVSLLEFEVFIGNPIKFLVAGYGPDDGGRLQVNMIYTTP